MYSVSRNSPHETKNRKRLKDASHFVPEASTMDATATETRVKTNKNVLQYAKIQTMVSA
jgi:hypothetical protein